MPEPKRPLKVFLCHASTDKPKVRELYRYLKKRGIQPWFDEEDLVGGQDWQVEIPKALATSDAIIICLTKNSVDKEGYIQKEIKFALDKALEMPEGRIFLIPVKFEECEVPFTLSRYQWVDLTVESGYAKMMKALKFRASQLERSKVEVSKKDVEEENLAREKAEKEAAEKARLEAEELARQKTAKEKAEREVTERAEKERKAKELREKQAGEAREKEKRESEKKEEKPVAVKPKSGGQIAYWFGGFIVLVLGIIFLSSLNIPPSTPQPTPENTQVQAITTLAQDTVETSNTVTLQSTSTLTNLLTHTPTSTESFTPTPELGIGSITISEKDGMTLLYVPAGNFIMGTNTGNFDEGDKHEVYLDAFWIDKTEVTNYMYSLCVQSGVCKAPSKTTFYDDSDYENHPVVYVSWHDAIDYCEWAGRKLPTEAEWEKAARGIDGRTFPWGEGTGSSYGNFNQELSTTTPVGSYESGKSPYGAYDMAGNVLEWTTSLYRLYPYNPDDGREDLNSDGSRILRGGSWNLVDKTVWTYTRPGAAGTFPSISYSARTTLRYRDTPILSTFNVGFRCVFNAVP